MQLGARRLSRSSPDDTTRPIINNDANASSSSLISSVAYANSNDITEANSISSRISLRHGISVDQLKLLVNNPPETKITNLTCNPTKDDTASLSDFGASDATIIDNQTGVELQRHSDLWFEDGSVICRAESMLFCVHMSQLARHSLVFHDMFMLPQSESTRFDSSMLLQGISWTKRKTTRSLPVVYLYDSAEDVANLFTALYDGPSFGNNDEDDFQLVSGILRLATKYLVDSLRAKALAHLTIAWPNNLQAWDMREDLARHSESSIRIRYPHPASVINLAREVDAPCLLSAAFYDISRHSFTQIFEPNEDDVLFRKTPPLRLSPQDMQRLCLGKETAQHVITALIQSLGNLRPTPITLSHSHGKRASPGLVCVSAAACRKDFTELVDSATQHYLFDRENGHCDPLYVAEELGQLKSVEFSECKACANTLESWAAREREKIWKMIPYWFRLEREPGTFN